MIIEEIRGCATPGNSISKSVDDAIKLAKDLDTKVTFIFNDIELTVSGQSDPRTIEIEYWTAKNY